MGAVKFQDGTILYCEYDGTSDVMTPCLRETVEEVRENWRKKNWSEHDETCTESEPVEVMSLYGGAFLWHATACRRHKLLTGGFMSDADDSDRSEGQPEWSPFKAK
jgi:hypothetical protein